MFTPGSLGHSTVSVSLTIEIFYRDSSLGSLRSGITVKRPKEATPQLWLKTVPGVKPGTDYLGHSQAPRAQGVRA